MTSQLSPSVVEKGKPLPSQGLEVEEGNTPKGLERTSPLLKNQALQSAHMADVRAIPALVRLWSNSQN